jgi:hypothetical protein
MRCAGWALTSFIFTVGWWIVASQVLQLHAPAAYFGFALLGSAALAWAFGLATAKTSWIRAVTISAGALAVVFVSFFFVAILASLDYGPGAGQNTLAVARAQ